jgi:hypothetical protein
VEYAFSVWAKSATEGEPVEIWGYYDWLDAGGTYIGGGWLWYEDWVEDDWEYADLGKRTAPAEATQAIFWLCGAPENGLMGAFFDDAYMDIPRPSIPSPFDGTLVLIGDVDLSWTNLASRDPNDPSVYVDVLFGTEPNKVDPDYNMEELILDPVSGQDVTSVTVNAPVDGETYYWQVNSYIYGDPAIVDYDTSDPNDPNMIEGDVWRFTAVSDLPPSVTIDTPAMIAWDNEPVQLDATVTDEGSTPLLIEWSVYPDDGVTFTPNKFVEDPVVSIVKGIYPNANILNPSFELRLAYWNQIGIGHGAWSGSWLEKFIKPSDGILLAYTDSLNNDGADAGLSQILAETFTAGTTYTLTVDVANDGYYDEQVDYRVQLLAGGVVLAEDNNEQHELPIPGGLGIWKTSTVEYVYDEVADANKLGEPLEIRLLAINGTNQMSFDNVHLTADPGFPVLPGAAYELTVTATDDIGSDSDTVEINLYDDACEAARVGLSLGAEHPGDIVSDSDSWPDCITDIYDLSEMALKWLLDTSPTEAFDDPKQPPDNPVINGIFDAYKPGSETITAEFIYDSFTRGVGENLPVLNSGIVIYSDGTSGSVVDCPGWVKVEGTGTNDLLNNGVGGSVGFNAFGTWSGGIGTMAMSDRPLGVISGGKNYTISAVVSGDAGPLVLDLLADGEVIPIDPNNSVTPAPSDLGDWQEISRTYTAGTLADHIGKSMKIVIGTTPPDLFGTRVIFDNVVLEAENSNPIFPDVDAGVDMVTWSDQAVQLAPTVVNNDTEDPQRDLSYAWSAGPDDGVVFTDPNTLAPMVTITKEPEVPSLVPFVINGGFEDPVLDEGYETFDTPDWVEGYIWLTDGLWYYDDTGYSSIYNPTIAADSFEAPEGQNVACVYTYPGYDQGLSQILGATLQAETQYDLSVQVGNPGTWNLNESLDYRVELWAGGSFVSGSPEDSVDPNEWETVNLSYNSGSSPAQEGEALEIRFIAKETVDADRAVYFDDVQLLINGESGEIVYYHLPTIVRLTLAATLEDYVPVFDTMVIDVYDTACLAAIDTDLDVLDLTDITADDCITNILDFAEIAEGWLVDYELTEPVEKP